MCEASLDFDSDLDPLDFNSVAVVLDFHRFSEEDKRCSGEASLDLNSIAVVLVFPDL